MKPLPEPRAALARLARRSAVRLARQASEASGVPFLLVGGAVRDALLGLPSGDVDLAVPRDGAAGFAAALARLAGTRVAPIGRAPRRGAAPPIEPGRRTSRMAATAETIETNTSGTTIIRISRTNRSHSRAPV